MKVKLVLMLIICSFILINSTSLSIVGATKNEITKTYQGYEEDIIEMIKQIDENLVYSYVEKLVGFGPRYTGSDNCSRAAEYIYKEFQNLSLHAEFHEWEFNKFKSRNVIGTQMGIDPSSNAFIIISAHYDTVPNSPGANDDGSGIAALLSIAHVLSSYSFNHTIRYIAFSGEEVGTYGSFSYARDAYRRGDNIYAVLNPDIIGWAETEYGGKIIRFSHTERASWIAEFARDISEKYQDIIDLRIEDIPNYPGSDHQAFDDYGYDSVWIVEHDPCRNCHSPYDNLTFINSTYLAKVTKLLLAVLAEMALKPIDIQVILKTPYEGMGYIFNNPIITLNFGKYYYMGLRGTTIILGRANASCEVYYREKVKFVIFCIDDMFLYWDRNPPYEWKIQGRYLPLIGRHKLKVYAYTESGKRATDEMEIIIFTLSYQYKK